MSSRTRIVIVGATSAIAEHCARVWLESRPADLVLLGRDRQRLERTANDLGVRSPHSEIRIVQAEFLDPVAIQAVVDDILQQGGVDIVLIAHGSLPDQRGCQSDLAACRDALEINGVSPVLFAEAFANRMAQAGRGTIAVIGSVAGDRGRKSNYVYGAAKGLITRYVQGLQHRFAGTKLRIVLIKPGPTDTPMTAELKGQGARLAPVESVAREIVAGIDAGKPTVYAPGKWKIIMTVVRHIPAVIFNRLEI
ncbi:short-chain dehydrogenase [Rhodopseudomonas sp. AAP120]|uniref:SDR family NAD(P)-dependent oxidoreductase n=1 Tax=Rhodopseudomonas sp. AAP120 TaxID=1523430 RepID=UPI0006B96FFF|nr:SDR family NAD(P)-dependent oxidoreductase [Rhodopseudomonas sp. AAP120]KPG00651.1 short-chain dehydrogenase [Rhodopseudomonas sp. AAP120]